MRAHFYLLLATLLITACNDDPKPADVSIGAVPSDSYSPPPPPPMNVPRPPAGGMGIRLQRSLSGDTLQSPFAVAGEATGPWYFEGQFLVKLYDSAQRLLAMAPAKAGSDWMTEAYVPFRAQLEWKNYHGKARLVLEADNPSGDAERDKRLEIPVHLY